MKSGLGFSIFCNELCLRGSLRIRWHRDVDHHPGFFDNTLLCRKADREGKGKIFIDGSRRFRNYSRSMRRRLAGRVTEGKLRLSGAWREPSPPSAVSLETLRDFTPPGGVLVYLLRDDGLPLGTIDSSQARICIRRELLLRGKIRRFFPGRSIDGKG